MDMQEFLMSKESNVTLDDVNLPKSTVDKIRKHMTTSPFTSESIESVGHVLLFGAPGTGKTFLSSAIAGELKSATCFSLSYYEIKNERFLRRIEIPLPDEDNRCKIFKTELDHAKVSLTEEQLLQLGRKTSGFTGSDIVIVVRGALMEPIRTVQKATHYMKVQENTKWTPCLPDAPGAVEMTWTDVQADELLEPTVTFADLRKSLSNCRPSVDDDYFKRYAQFLQEASTASV